MKDSKSWLEKQIALCLIAFIVPIATAEMVPMPSSASLPTASGSRAGVSASQANIAGAALPDSPGAMWVAAQNQSEHQSQAQNQQQSTPAADAPATNATAAPAQDTSTPGAPAENSPAQSTPAQQQGPDQQTSPQQNSSQPVGTAVAPEVKAEGVTAARPTGAAIAPAKQKRAHSFAIRMALVVAAVVAVGVVVGLSEGSSSKPH